MKRKISLIVCSVLLLLSLLAFSACSAKKLDLDDGDGTLYQYEMPEVGDSVAVMHTSLGDMTIRFFEDDAPKAVENFLTHAKEGYYDGCTFYRVISDFMIQSGNPENTTTGGESIWGKYFEDEFSSKLHVIYGALCMTNIGKADTNASQFFFVTNKNIASRYKTNLAQTQKETPVYGYTDKVIEAYVENGGCPWLDRVHTVFGQVIDGFDVLDKIGRQQTDENDVPLTDVVINSIEVIPYAG